MKTAYSDDVLTRPMLELWVPRATIELLVLAAVAFRDFHCDDDDVIDQLDDAVKIIQDAVVDDMQPLLNENSLL